MRRKPSKSSLSNATVLECVYAGIPLQDRCAWSVFSSARTTSNGFPLQLSCQTRTVQKGGRQRSFPIKTAKFCYCKDCKDNDQLVVIVECLADWVKLLKTDHCQVIFSVATLLVRVLENTVYEWQVACASRKRQRTQTPESIWSIFGMNEAWASRAWTSNWEFPDIMFRSQR